MDIAAKLVPYSSIVRNNRIIVSQFEDFQELAPINTNHLINPCAIYWDFENVKVESAPEADQFIQRVRSEVILNKGLQEVEFVCVCGSRRLHQTIENQIKSSNVKIFYVQFKRNAADWKIVEHISNYVKSAGQGCNLALISGDSDFVKTLYRSKIRYNAKIYLIHLENHKNDFLESIADEVYLFTEDGQLRRVTEACDVAVINIKPLPEVFNPESIRKKLLSMLKHEKVTKDSIYFDQQNNCIDIWVGFSNKETAKNVEHDYKKQPDNTLFSNIRYVQYPPYHVIRRFFNPKVREKTLNTLNVLDNRSISSSQISLTPSTLSLPFKNRPTYLIIEGFPDLNNEENYRMRHKRLSKLLRIPVDDFKSCFKYTWFEVYKIHGALKYIDQINGLKFQGSKLSARVAKHPPTYIILQSGEMLMPVVHAYQPNFFARYWIVILGFVLIALFLVILIIIFLAKF